MEMLKKLKLHLLKRVSRKEYFIRMLVSFIVLIFSTILMFKTMSEIEPKAIRMSETILLSISLIMFTSVILYLLPTYFQRAMDATNGNKILSFAILMAIALPYKKIGIALILIMFFIPSNWIVKRDKK